jgi:putative transposase
MIKRLTSQGVTKQGYDILKSNTSRAKRRESTIWQRRFWEHQILNEQSFITHVEYCYFNPVKHDLVSRVIDWPFSTFHRDVKLGLFSKDWAAQSIAELSSAGE